jgi:adhesin/invasin
VNAYAIEPGGPGGGDAGVTYQAFNSARQRIITIRDQNGVLNGASFASAPIAPGTFMSIFGTNLATTTATWNPINYSLPTVLGGTSVLVNGEKAYINYVSPGQVNFPAPAGSDGGAWLQITSTDLSTSNPIWVPGRTIAPALFMFSQSNYHYAISTLPSGLYAIPPNLLPAIVPVRAAKPGEVLAFWATGFGPTTPAYPEGQVLRVQDRSILANPVTVTIGGKNAAIDLAGIVGAGLYQVNAHVPDVPAGDTAVVITVGGVSTQSGAYVPVGN